MRTLLIGIACMLLVQNAVYAKDADFIIAIHVHPVVAKVGEAIRIEVGTTNITSRSMPLNHVLAREQAETDNIIHLKDQDGNTPQKTRYYRMFTGEKVDPLPLPDGVMSPGFQSSETSIMLAPGERYVDTLVLNKLYDLDKPGIYVVQLARKISSQDGSYYIKSNILSITVLPRD